MSKKFRNWSPDQTWLLPPSPRDWLDDGHLVYFLLDVVGEMDLSPFFEVVKFNVVPQRSFDYGRIEWASDTAREDLDREQPKEEAAD